MPHWRDEHIHLIKPTDNSQWLKPLFLQAGNVLGELIYAGTADHYLALWKERKSISLPHKNHLNTNQILKGQLEKKNHHVMTALSLTPSAPDCSLILLLCPSSPSVGHSVSARECQREQSELIKDLPYAHTQEIRCEGEAEISQHAQWDSRHGDSKRIYTDCSHFYRQRGGGVGGQQQFTQHRNQIKSL